VLHERRASPGKDCGSAVTDRRYRTFETSCNFKHFENIADDFSKRSLSEAIKICYHRQWEFA
jgi:hypothetical protein